VNGPVPLAVVAKLAVEPAQIVWLAGDVAPIAVLTASAALGSTELHAPLTTTEYVAASEAWTFVSERLDAVAPPIGEPFFFHW
jgi:hypothetical protein